MTRIIEPKLSYTLTGLFYKVHRELGRFCRERQYGDCLEDKFKRFGLQYKRECELSGLAAGSPKGNRVDFLVEAKVILDLKAKNFITKEDYFQMQRYLRAAGLELGIIINFRQVHLKPKRVLNPECRSGHSDINSGN